MIFIGGGGGGGALLVLLVMAAFFVAVFVLLPLSLVRGVRSMSSADRRDWTVPEDPVLPEVTPADVQSLRDRLGHDVRTLDPGGDRVARQALTDASERFSTSGTLLEQARSAGQVRTAWLTAREGLEATRVVRTRLGLDTGVPLPELPAAAPTLRRPVSFTVDGEEHYGSPSYSPGQPHWFPGGRYGRRRVPSGWYDAPFWPGGLLLGGLGGLAIGGALGGALGGGLDGGDGYDEGFGGGLDTGGGDWGGDAGGDW